MKIATFHSATRRQATLTGWLSATSPDVVCLQELDEPIAALPADELREVGYRATLIADDSWDGSAILSRWADPVSARNEFLGDNRSWIIEAAVKGVRVAQLCVPTRDMGEIHETGGTPHWRRGFAVHASHALESGDPIIITGDCRMTPAHSRFNLTQNHSPSLAHVGDAFDDLTAKGWAKPTRSPWSELPKSTLWEHYRAKWGRCTEPMTSHVLLSPSIKQRLLAVGVDTEFGDWVRSTWYAPTWITVSD
jgi:exodeoxyribonuclease III